MKKWGGKTGDSIDEKPPKLNQETRRKPIIYYYFVRGKKPLKLSQKNGEKKPDAN